MAGHFKGEVTFERDLTGAFRADEADRVADPALEGMSQRERKRYEKELSRQLKEQQRTAERELRESKKDKKKAASASEISKTLKARAKESEKRVAAQRARRLSADNTADAIGYNLMFENGICEVEEGYFSETMEFEDTTYQSARESRQREILSVLVDLYNYFSPDTTVQLSIVNSVLRPEEMGDGVFYDPESQGNAMLRRDAEIMNELLSDKLKEGVSNIRRRRFITVGVPASSVEDARVRLSRINTDIQGSLEQIKCPTRVLKGTERLEVVSGLLRPNAPYRFSYDSIFEVGYGSSKDAIAPMVLDFSPEGGPSYFTSDKAYCQVLAMRQLDSPLDDGCVAKLIDMQIPLEVTWFLRPWEKSKAINDVKVSRALIETEIINEQQKAVSKGYDYSILPSEVQYSREETEDLLSKLQGQQQHLFDWCGLIYTWADSTDALFEQVLQIIDTAASAGITVETLEYRQRQGMNSVLPLGLNHVELTRPLLTTEAAIFVPFATRELSQPGGNWYYQNKLSNNLVFGNRANLASPVGFISGKTGSGKGFFAKNEILGTLLSKPTDQIIIFDRAGEYRALVEHAGGTYATFGVGKPTHINPLDMTGLETHDFTAQVANKADAMIAQAAASATEAGVVFTDEERSIIQRCVERVLVRARKGGREALIGDLYRELRAQPEPIAESIALRYERYVTGSTDFFNHPTDVSMDNRLIALNFKDVQDSMLVFALISFCETVRYIMYKNFEQGRRTWLYIEEMESLFKYPSVLNYFRRFSNECRKFGMYLTGITQSTEAMIANQDANAIVKNSDFVMLLKQSKEDRDYWTDALGLSPAEAMCIDESAKRGWGLLVFGDARIPIKGDFPRDNDIYRLFSTDPNEGWQG